MPLCYWDVCHCPEAQPCREHRGISCGEWNGQSITDLAAIQDAVTRASETAIARIAADESEIGAALARTEARKAELERTRDQLSREFDQAPGDAERQAVADRAQTTITALRGLDQEASALLDRFEAVSNRWQDPLQWLAGDLLDPFSDATGYCRCYTVKRARLAALSRQIARGWRDWRAYDAELSGLRAQLPHLIGSVLAVGVSIALWGAVGGLTVFWFLFLALMAAALLLLALIIRVLYLQRARGRLARRLASLQLAYRRMQQILTCQRLPAGDGPIDGLQWWDRILEGLPPPPESGAGEESAGPGD